MDSLEATAGVEPADSGFADRSLSHLGTPPSKRTTRSGAGEGARTLDPHVGNVMLYH